MIATTIIASTSVKPRVRLRSAQLPPRDTADAFLAQRDIAVLARCVGDADEQVGVAVAGAADLRFDATESAARLPPAERRLHDDAFGWLLALHRGQRQHAARDVPDVVALVGI